MLRSLLAYVFLTQNPMKSKKVKSALSHHSMAAAMLSECIHEHLSNVDGNKTGSDSRGVRDEPEIRSESNPLKPTSDKIHRKIRLQEGPFRKKRSR